MDSSKIENLRRLLAVIVKNTKDNKTTPNEEKLIKKVLKDMLGREPMAVEVVAVTPL